MNPASWTRLVSSSWELGCSIAPLKVGAGRSSADTLSISSFLQLVKGGLSSQSFQQTRVFQKAKSCLLVLRSVRIGGTGGHSTGAKAAPGPRWASSLPFLGQLSVYPSAGVRTKSLIFGWSSWLLWLPGQEVRLRTASRAAVACSLGSQ